MRLQLVATETRLPQPVWATAIVATWAVLVALALFLSYATGRAVSLCWFREVFGVPCLSCGGTRCTLELMQGHWLSALSQNPLVAIEEGIIAVWITAHVGFRRSLRIEWSSRQRRLTALAMGLAIIANWAYVIWSHSID